jgi:HK97 family phage major capsid protein/HK97 family phage prohead protease
MEKRHIFVSELRASGNVITGTIPYHSKSHDLGGFTEVLLPGAFTKAIKGKKILALLAHDKTKPLANSERGTLKLTDGPTALTVAMSLDPSISWHADALAACRRGDFGGLSFGFKIDKGGERWREQNGNRVRELVTVDLREVSPVVFAAYPSTTISVRSNYSTSKGNKNMTKNEMRQEKARLLSRMRELDKLDENTETRSEYDRLDAEYERLSDEISKADRSEKLAMREIELSQSQGSQTRPMPERTERRESPGSREEQREVEMLTRAISMDGGTDGGGYLILPTSVQKNVITKLKDDLFILSRADVITVPDASAVSWPALDHDPGDSSLAFTAELKTGSEDSTMDFDARQLAPRPLARRIKISKKLARAAGIDVVALVEDRLKYVFGMVLEHQFLNGLGTNSPLGIFATSAHGVNTDRDMSTDNTATLIKADNLINCAYALKAQYLKRASWVFHRDAMKMIRKLKDGEGNYLYQPQLTESTPAMLLGRPVDVSEYCPNTFTSGSLVGALLDWSFYKVVFALNWDVQILTELYAETNQLGLIARMEVDAMPALSESVVRVKMG